MGAPMPTVPFYEMMTRNLRLLWVFVYELPPAVIDEAANDIGRWLVESECQFPEFHAFDLEDIVRAHEAVESAVQGKVLVQVAGGD